MHVVRKGSVFTNNYADKPSVDHSLNHIAKYRPPHTLAFDVFTSIQYATYCLWSGTSWRLAWLNVPIRTHEHLTRFRSSWPMHAKCSCVLSNSRFSVTNVSRDLAVGSCRSYACADEGVSKSFRTGRLKRELQIIQLCATMCSCISILWVSLVSFAAVTLCVASQRVFIVVSIYFFIDSVRKLLDTPWSSLIMLPCWCYGVPKCPL
jgi:hypothetical protein